MAKQKRLYAHVILVNGKELVGEIDALYSFKNAVDMLTASKPESVVMIGDYLAVRVGDFQTAYVTCEDPEEVEA